MKHYTAKGRILEVSVKNVYNTFYKLADGTVLAECPVLDLYLNQK